MPDTTDLGLILDSGVPIVVIETPDEPRVLAVLLRLAMRRAAAFYDWTVTGGLKLSGFGDAPKDGDTLTDPTELLAHIAHHRGPAIFALCDLHPYLQDATNVRHLKDAALAHERLQNTIVLVSHKLDIPPELGRLSAKFSLRLPTDDEITALIREEAKLWAAANSGKRVRTDQETLDKLIANLRGLSHADARILIRRAIFSDGAITETDIPAVNKLKFELLGSEGVLRLEHHDTDFTQVAGLNRLESWLSERRRPFLDGGVDRPRGTLLVGVQGGGKSLAAKAVAGHWGVPLLRLDFGTLYNKYFGETERNLRNSLQQAELMAPCVLWMDEIEKGLATGTSDNATSQRVMGTLLTWMAENSQRVFIVATANDISGLPPELARKGRLDEVFFVDLPDEAGREAIFRIHLAQRDLCPDDFDLTELARNADGFTGAEIEQAIVSARYAIQSNGTFLTDGSPTDSSPTEIGDVADTTCVTQADLVAALNGTYPMSVLRAEDIQALRAWAEGRAVIA